MSESRDAKNSLQELRRRFALLADLGQASSLLSWDQHTYMPSGAAAGRGQQMASLSAVVHEKLTDAEVGRWLEEAEAGSPTGDDAAFLRLARRAYDRSVKLPGEFVERLTKHRSTSQQSWVEARRENDFAHFAPDLERMFELCRQHAEYLGYDEHPYDALHDLYEPGSSTARVREVFGPLRTATVELVEAIRESGRQLDDSPLRGDFDEAGQEAFSRREIERFGYDFRHGRLDPSVHPFAQGMGSRDVRITTRYRRDFLSTSLFATFHEAGHAIYEQGIADELARSPLGEAVSLAVHESQSRLWENLVGRSRAFWEGAYARLQEHFPSELGPVSLDAFHAAINRVEPTFIRVEADEVTYNLHVMVRFEIELALLEGSLDVADLPRVWNSKYRDYLGIEPPTDTLGCLQDVHWSIGLVGYFPTYALGNLMSVQLFEAAEAALPDLEESVRQGRFEGLLGWLRENVHRHGSRYQPEELLERATGRPLDPAPYLAYLGRKYRSLYELG